MKYLTILFSLLCLCIGSINAQTIPYDNFTTDDGLADNNTFDIIADSTGFLWIGTDNGLVKFDGTTFKTYNVEQGLKSPIITAISISDNRFLIECFRQGIQEFNGSAATDFLLQKENEQIHTHLTYHQGRHYFIDGNHNKQVGFIENNRIILFANTHGNCILAYNNNLYIGTDSGLYKLQNDRFTKVPIKGLGSYPVYSIVSNGESLWLGGKGEILQITDNKVVKKTITNLWKGKIISKLCIDDDQNVWMSTFNGGLYYEKDNRVITLLDSNIWISDIYKDQQGFIWIATYGNGIYKFYNSYIADYSYLLRSAHKSVTEIDKLNGFIFIAGNNETVIIDTLIQPQYVNTARILPRRFLYKNNTSFIIGQTQDEITEKFIRSGNFRFHFYHGTVATFVSDTILKIGSYGNFYTLLYKNNQLKMLGSVSYDNSSISRANSLITINDTFWVGTTGSTYKIHGNHVEKVDYPLLKNVNELTLDKDSNLWFATVNGLIMLPKPYNPNYAQVIIKGSFNAVSSVNNQIWAGAAKGLYIITKDETLVLTASQGVPGSNITALFYDEEKKDMWIGTDKGVCAINTLLFKNVKFLPPIKILFEEIATEDSTYRLTDEINLGHKTGYLQVRFSALNFSGMGSAVFQYSLDGENWITTKDKNLYVTLASLKYGEHTLNIRGMNPNSTWCYADKLVFYIETPFYKSAQFYILIVLFSLLIITAFAYYRIKTAKQKQADELELERKINQLQNMSLSAMMNPHFIFNSLSSIQYLVNTAKTDLANTYIAKLARLIRMNLTDADEEEIALNREIERVELYLKLEQLRFEDKFDYEITIPDTIDIEEISIPPLVLQPLVENCIKHGIMPLHKKGFIDIKFYRKGELLYIHIKDNGVGLGEAKSTAHLSKGLYIIKERILLRNDGKVTDNDFEIRELIDKKGNITGTVAIVKLKIKAP